MTRNLTWIGRSLVVGLGVLVLAAPTVAGVDDFKLAKAIPGDAALAAHAREHDGKAFLNAQYERVWKAVEKQHFEKDLRTLLKGLYEQQGGDLEQFEKLWQQFNDLLLGVEWSTLCEKEMAFAMKLGFPTPEFVFLTMSAPEKAKTNFAGLEAILKTLVGFAPEGAITLSTQGEGDAVVHTASATPAPGVTFTLMLARHKDVLLMGFGQTMPEQTLALLRGDAGQSLAATPRMQEAFKQLPPPADGYVYFDIARLMGQVRALIDKAMAEAQKGGEPLDPKIQALPGKLIDALDIFEYLASVETTNGMKTTEENVVLLKSGAKSRPLYGVLFGNPTLNDPLKFIPQEAKEFSVWSGFNLRALYDAVIAFIRDEVPDGAAALAEWENGKKELKEQYQLDVEADLLDWVGGGVATFSIPGKTAYSGSSTVFMLSVKNEVKAREMLGRLCEALEPFLKQQNGMIDDAKIEGAEGFKVVVLPILAMVPGFSQPTLGVHAGQLFVGANPKVVAAALDTAAGKSPNVSKNERFQKEGLPLDKNVTALGFRDLTTTAEELGTILKMVPMLESLAPQIVQNPVAKAVVRALGKVGIVVQELNFLQSSCAQTTFDGQVLHTKSVTNYREPPAKPTATAPAEAEKPTDKPASPGK